MILVNSMPNRSATDLARSGWLLPVSNLMEFVAMAGGLDWLLLLHGEKCSEFVSHVRRIVGGDCSSTRLASSRPNKHSSEDFHVQDVSQRSQFRPLSPSLASLNLSACSPSSRPKLEITKSCCFCVNSQHGGALHLRRDRARGPYLSPIHHSLHIPVPLWRSIRNHPPRPTGWRGNCSLSKLQSYDQSHIRCQRSTG